MASVKAGWRMQESLMERILEKISFEPGEKE